MDKKIVGLLGAVAALATVGGAQASTAPVQMSNDAQAVRSYADLLAPIQNATEALAADNAMREQAVKPAGGAKLAQYHHHHHHHHHHHVIVIRKHRHHRHHHHHHHHHHHGAFIGVPGVGGVVVR
jgi:hypothetical protein